MGSGEFLECTRWPCFHHRYTSRQKDSSSHNERTESVKRILELLRHGLSVLRATIPWATPLFRRTLARAVVVLAFLARISVVNWTSSAI